MLQSQGGIKEIGEEVGADKSTKLGSNDTKEMVNILSSMEAVNILTSRGAAASVSLADVLPAVGVPTVSGSFPTASTIFTTASVVTPYTRRPRGIIIGSSQPMRSPIIIGAKDKGKEKVVKSEVPKKRKLQEQIDAQVAREIEEEFARENQRVSEQRVRDSEIARLHVEKELKMMIEGEKLELISELVKYQDHHAKILKYQAQQSKPLSKKEKMEFYMSVLKNEDFVPMSSKEESERVKRQGLKIDQGGSKRMKTFEDVSEEELKGMMQLVPLKEVYVEALQVKHPIIDWEIYSEGKREEDLHQLWTLVKETFCVRQATIDKENKLWVELKRLFEPNFEDQLWTYNQAFMHDPLDWKLYDTCGVHHVSTKDQEIFMLVERDYPLRKRLVTNRGVIDSGYSRHMAGNMSYLTDYKEIDKGYVAFEKNPKGWKITRKMCDKKNSVLFNDTEYLEDQLWTHYQAFMHDPLDWKLYNTCGVHHVSTKDQEIFMLVKKDYPLRKGLATVILYEELFEASSPDEHLIMET
nr:hypothetical protein [Tanacetum cinerariifolium]